MLYKIIEWSLRNPFLILVSTLAIIIQGMVAITRTPLDALPDLSDVQVIIYTEYPGQAPQVVEDQVTYPLTTAMLSAPKSKVVRGYSFFGVSFIYILFEDGTDVYWARSRVLEYLNTVSGRLPKGVSPRLGPDASGVGWIYQYAVLGKESTLAELRSLQDWFLRFQLSKAGGVSEIASVGGFVQEYQVTLDPQKLRAYRISLNQVANVIRGSNSDIGGRVVEIADTEYMVRGRGYLKGVSDIERLVISANKNAPIRIKDLGRVELVPAERRGIAELNGEQEVVSGIGLARYGENALTVINNIKQKIAELSSGLPEGVRIEPVYDRSELIYRAIDNLKQTLLEESLIVALICAVFLLHLRSALVAIMMLPVGILMAFIVMERLHINSNIMSLGGIAIAIGAMVDAAIVMVENAHKHLERASPNQPRLEIISRACREVGPSLFFSLLIITVSFLPVFTLESQEGRLFTPLAFTKTFAMAGAAILSVTLVPVLMWFWIRGKILPESRNPINRILILAYRPVLQLALQWKRSTIAIALLVFLATFIPLKQLGSEFMPTLNEGTLLFMPTTLPGIGITTAAELLQMQDRIIKSFPEVASVLGKAGRALTATDSAPLEMSETIVNLKPESEWRNGMTVDRLISEMSEALSIPGVSNAWTMPIKNRIDMLATGIRTPVGVKIFGKDLNEMEKLAEEIERIVKSIPGTASAYAERTTGGYYLNIDPNYEGMARYGVFLSDVQETLATALGGETVTTTVEGRERFGVNIRYPRELRDNPMSIASNILVPAPNGSMVPIGQVCKISLAKGAPSIRTENGLLSAYVFIDIRDRDLGSYVTEAQEAVRHNVRFPPGYYANWSGQFEFMKRANERLRLVLPVTGFLIFLLLYLNFRNLQNTLIVILSVPFSLVGGVWLIWALNFNLSVAVAVGFIALAGVATETGVIMLLYLEQAWRERQAWCRAQRKAAMRVDLFIAILEGAVERVRPKMMTVVAIMAGLLPILWSQGTGSELMRRIAAPMVGGMLSSTILTLIVIPVIYSLIHEKQLKKSR